MKKEPLKTKLPFRKDNSTLNNSLRTFDLPTLIEKIKHEHAWTSGEINAMFLFKSPKKHIVLTALHEGTEIKSFRTNDSITFQIIEGKLMFHTRKESVTLEKGQLMTLHENIKYNLTTKEETVFLITIARGNLHQAKN